MAGESFHLTGPRTGMTFSFPIALRQQADTKLCQTNATIAAGDFTLSMDGGSFANLVNTPSVIPASGYQVLVTLSNTETACRNAMVMWHDASGAQWCDDFVCIQFAPGLLVYGSVSETHASSSTTYFESGTITEATASHFNGRTVNFVSGPLAGQSTNITSYAASGGYGGFTVTALTESATHGTEFYIA